MLPSTPVTETSAPTSPLATVAIVGVGLIGGSLGLALRNRKLSRVIGIGRDLHRLNAALAAGVVDAVTTDLEAGVAAANLVVVCTPVEQIVPTIRAAAKVVRPGTILTDAGSVKSKLCVQLQDQACGVVCYVGSHPMAGSEKQGWEHANEQLFDGRVCVLTPYQDSPAWVVEYLQDFWQSVGLRTHLCLPDEHDELVARISHLTHVLAAVAAKQITPAASPLASTGYRDTTRIAAGDARLWSEILLANSHCLIPLLDDSERTLAQVRSMLAKRDESGLQDWLQGAKTLRDDWERSQQCDSRVQDNTAQ